MRALLYFENHLYDKIVKILKKEKKMTVLLTNEEFSQRMAQYEPTKTTIRKNKTSETIKPVVEEETVIPLETVL